MIDTDPPFSHTLFFRKTEDYGETWSSDGGYKNSGYHYISDETLVRLSDSLYSLWTSDQEKYDDKPWYTDTTNFSDDDADFLYTPGFFLGYSYDMVTDHDGGLHFVANTGVYLCRDVNGVVKIDGDFWLTHYIWKKISWCWNVSLL